MGMGGSSPLPKPWLITDLVLRYLLEDLLEGQGGIGGVGEG